MEWIRNRDVCAAKMSRYATVIFDLDGTLIDSAPGVKESFRNAVKAVLPDVEFDLGSVVIGPPLPKMFEVAYPTATTEQVKALVAAFRADYNESGWKKTRLFVGVKDALSELQSHGAEMFVVTNKPLDISQKILQFFELTAFFTDVRSLDSVVPSYANKAEMVRALLRERNLKPEQCVLIGDTKGDADAARTVEMSFIWVSFGYGKRDDILDVVKSVDSFRELTELCLR